jgi:cytochrome b561
MSFREKTAWGMGLILILAGAWYFSKVVSLSTALGHTSPPDLHFFIGYVVLVVIASIVVNVTLAVTSGKEASVPVDEREKAILDKAGHWSGYVLALGAFSGLWHFGWQDDGNMLFHVIFGSLMLSQIAEYAFQIFLYRRGV